MENLSRLVNADRLSEDREEQSLRPSSLNEFVGQRKIVDNLRVFIQSARMRKTPSTMCFWPVRPGWARPRSRL